MKEFLLTHFLKNVSNMQDEEPQYGESEEHFGCKWHLCFERKNNNLDIYIYCINPCKTDEWSISTDFELKLLSSKGRTMFKLAEATFEPTPEKKVPTWGFSPFVKWQILIKNYVVDDSVTIQAHVKIEKMNGFDKKLRDFSESAAELSDVVMIVENQKFFVSKLFLAVQSSYFKSLLFGNFEESKKSEIPLYDINATDFQKFLEALHGDPAISDNTVGGILRLADMYDAKTVIRQCENFLMEESSQTLKEKLKIAEQFNFKSLRNNCLSKIKTVEDIRSVVPGNLMEMDKEVLASLLQKSLSFQ